MRSSEDVNVEIKATVSYIQQNKRVTRLLYRMGNEKTLRELDITNVNIDTEDDVYELADMLIQQYEAQQQLRKKIVAQLTGRKITKEDIERWKRKKLQEEVEEWKTESLDFLEL